MDTIMDYWQNCPHCGGHGQTQEGVCPVCNGERIINILTGRPPAIQRDQGTVYPYWLPSRSPSPSNPTPGRYGWEITCIN